MSARRNPLWLIVLLSFLVVYCGVHFNLNSEDWIKIFEKTGAGGTNYLYAATSNGIFAYVIDSSTGALTTVPGSSNGAGYGFGYLSALQDEGSILFGGRNAGTELWNFGINDDGTLSGPKILTQSYQTRAITIDPQEHFAYSCDQLDGLHISGYTIDLSSYNLIPLAAPFASSCSPRSLVLSPDGRYLYEGGYNNYIFKYDCDTTTGSLSSFITYASHSNVDLLAMHPAGSYLYSATVTSNNVYCYPIDSTGALATGIPYQLGQGPGNFGAGNHNINDFCIDPAGQALYATISAYPQYGISRIPLTAAGALDGAGEQIFGTQNSPHSPVVEPTNNYLYIVDDNAAGTTMIKAYKIEGNALQLLSAPACTFPGVNVSKLITVSKAKY